tara:strand:- start:416 stop:2464 length:2049 start_codon:yes stop_codon:yes gene_type:complete
MIFYFASFMVNEKNCTLTKNHQSIEIEPKIFSLLCFFCRNAQRAISRDELIEKVWQGRIVSNAAINRAVGELRKAIEVDVKDPQYIVTISKVGYQFNAIIDQQENSLLVNSNIANQPKQTNKSPIHLLLYFAALVFIVFTLFIYLNYTETSNNPDQFNVSAATPVTTIKGSAFKPQLFENGQAVFLHKNIENNNVQLWLQVPGLSATQLTNDSYYYTYAIFTDADTIFATRFDNLATRNCQIIKFVIATQQSEKIANCAKRAVTHLAFNNESRKLYFNFRDSVSQPYAIRSLQLDTGRIQQLTHADPSGNTRGDYLFSLSPSGKQMAILEYQQDGAAMLKVIDIASPMSIARYQSYYDVSAISWFNEKILLISEDKGVLAYNLANADGKYIVQEENITQGTYSPALSLLSYVKFDRTRNIYQKSEHSGPHEEALTHSTHSNFLPIYANTSNALVYFSTDSGKVNIKHLDQLGKTSNLNFPTAIKHFGNLKWTRDDSAIFTTINSKLFHYSMATRQWQKITTNLERMHYVEIINSQQVIVSSDQSGDWQLWQIDLSSAKTKQITKNGGYSASYVKAKNSLLLSKYSQDGLFELDLNDLSEVKVRANFKITDWNKWQLRGDDLYSWENKAIVKLNLATNSKSTLWQLNQHNPSRFSINFDGSKLAYSVTEQEKSTIWQRSVLLE